MTENKTAAKLQLGWKVFAGLIVLSLLEYWVAAMAQGPIPYPVLCWPLAPITWIAMSAAANPLPYLVAIALLKAVLIARYFMHIAQAWHREREEVRSEGK